MLWDIVKNGKLGHVVNNELLYTDDYLNVLNKVNNETLIQLSNASEDIVLQAIDAAKGALKNELDLEERCEILEKSAALFLENKEQLAQFISLESGKTIKDALAEVERGANTFKVAAQEARSLGSEVFPLKKYGGVKKIAFTLRMPIGIVCAITPFNYPFNLTAHKVAPAIAAGNAVVLKPAEKTPLSAYFIAKLMEEAGLPAGYLNIVNGDGKQVGDLLLKNPDISFYTFTGSPRVGEYIKNNTGIRPVTLELGNNSANIIHKDVADLDRAVNLCVTRAFSNTGQACISVQRVYIHEDIFEEFSKKAKEVAASLVVGDPLDPKTDIGPVIDQLSAERIESWINEAVSQGAEIVAGGQRNGNYISPTILTNVTANMKVVCEEVFGPVLSVIKYSDLEDVVEQVNNSRFGLQTGVFTSNINTALNLAQKIESGGININDVSTFRADALPYGGVKDSGIGKEGPRSAIKEMSIEKLITITNE